MRDSVDLVVHQELLVGRELHNDDPEVGAAQVQGQEFAVLLPVGQAPDVSGVTLDTRGHLVLFFEAFLQYDVKELCT